MIQQVKYFLLALAVAISCTVVAQDSESPLLRKIQKVYGSNDVLHQGYIYRAESRGAKGHPYLWDQYFLEGSVFIQDFEFADTPIRYNIETDQLVMRTMDGNLSKDIALSAEHIDSFLLSGYKFINRRWIDSNLNFNYALELFHGNKLWYTTLQKQFVGIYNQQTPNGKYGDTSLGIHVQSNNERFDISTKRMLFKAFPEHKKAIKGEMKARSIRYHKATTSQLIGLFQFIDNL